MCLFLRRSHSFSLLKRKSSKALHNETRERDLTRLVNYWNAAHFSMGGAFFPVCCTFLSVPQFNKCSAFCHFATVFQLWRSFPRVEHFSECAACFQVCPTFPSAAHFSKCAVFFQVCRIFLSVTHLFKCGTFVQVCRSFPIVSHSSKCGRFSRFFPRVPVYKNRYNRPNSVQQLNKDSWKKEYNGYSLYKWIYESSYIWTLNLCVPVHQDKTLF